jgi:hypothetical protein
MPSNAKEEQTLSAMRSQSQADSLKLIAQKSEKETKIKLENLIENASPLVMPEKMNVVFYGVANPIAFSVPGFPPENVIPFSSKGSKILKNKNGSYDIVITDKNTKEVKIGAQVKIGNTYKTLKGSQPVFRVKWLPDPSPYVDGFFGKTKFKSKDLKNFNQIRVALTNSDYNINYEVISFKTVCVFKDDFYEWSNTGPQFGSNLKSFFVNRIPNNVWNTDDVFEDNGTTEIKPIKSEIRFAIEELKVKLPDGQIKTLNSWLFTVEKD